MQSKVLLRMFLWLKRLDVTIRCRYTVVAGPRDRDPGEARSARARPGAPDARGEGH